MAIFGLNAGQFSDFGLEISLENRRTEMQIQFFEPLWTIVYVYSLWLSNI